MIASWLFDRTATVDRAARPRARRRRSRPAIQYLEDRCVPATIFVTGLADGPGNAALVQPVPGGFLAPTLRSAISFANSNPADNTIALVTPGVYQISIPNAGGVGENLNQTGDFDILPSGGNLTIANQSGGAVTVSGGGLDRVFDINPNNAFNPATPTAPFKVTMSGFTITDGLAFSSAFTTGAGALGSGNNPSDVSGGAIRDSFNASLTLTNMVLNGNTAQAAGGAISMENPLGFSTPWTLRVQNSTISNNRAGDAGGGINTKGSGRVVVTQSVISGNVCPNQGAGIWLDTIDVGAVHQSAVLTVDQSFITGNVGLAGGSFGGGIGNAGNNSLATGQIPLAGEVQRVTITNSTISNNATAGSGGGYGAENGQGTLFVQNSTFAANSANAGGGIQADGPTTTILNSTVTGNSSRTVGGGIDVTAGIFVLNNTIVAQNYAGPTNFLGGTDPDVFGTVTAPIGDFIGIKGAGLTLAGGSFNQVGTPAAPLHPHLGALQNNGGPLAGAPAVTQIIPTLAPLPGSLVIDKGVNTGLLATDERGFVRIVNNTVDIGAVEFQPPTTITTLFTTSNTLTYFQPVTFTAVVAAQTPGNPVTGTVTFRIDGVPVATVPLNNGTAQFTLTLVPHAFANGPHAVTATYNGDVNFTPSAGVQIVTVPALPVLTTTLTRKRGRFTLQVFSNGQFVQQFALNAPPNIQMTDFNGDGVADLVIHVRKGRNVVLLAVFSGVTAHRIA